MKTEKSLFGKIAIVLVVFIVLSAVGVSQGGIAEGAVSYTVTLDGMGATTQTQTSVEVQNGGDFPDVIVPVRTGYTFRGYFSEEGDRYIDWEGHGVRTYDKTEDSTLFARWTQGKVVEIDSKSDMEKFSASVGDGTFTSGTVLLTANVDVSSSTAFAPIGNSEHYFEGTFDGQGYTVTVLLNKLSESEIGLFGCAGSNAVIKNVTVAGSVSGRDYVGGVVGKTDKSSVIRNCLVSASVYGTKYVGGIAGYSEGFISSCVQTGSVTAKQYFGGLVGSNDSNGQIQDSVFVGSYVEAKTGATDFGGLVGLNSGLLQDSYFNGSFSGAVGNVAYGSIIGQLKVSNKIKNVYALTDKENTVGNNTTGSMPSTMKKVTLYDFLSQSVYFSSGCDLQVLSYEEGFGYLPSPSFIEKETIAGNKFRRCLFNGGNGTETTPFLLTEKEQWLLFCTNSALFDYQGKFIRVQNNITLGKVSPASTITKPFAGTLDGREHQLIFNITGNGENIGLFSCVDGATVKDIVLSGTVSSSSRNVGTLIGQAKGTVLLQGITVFADRKASGTDSVGGLVGLQESGTLTIRDCDVACNVDGQNGVGGLVGFAQGTLDLSDSHLSGTISVGTIGAVGVGGAVGKSTDELHIENVQSLSTEEASVATAVGGLVGSMKDGELISVAVLSEVKGRYRVGGLIGEVTGGCYLTAGLFIGSIKGSNYLSSLVGMTVGASGVFSVNRQGGADTDYVYSVCRFIEDTSVNRVGVWNCSQVTNISDGGSKDVAHVFYDSDISEGSADGSQGKNTVQMTDGAWCRTSYWQVKTQTVTGGSYPVPSFVTNNVSDFYVSYFASGKGTSDEPFTLSTEQHLRNFSNLLNGYPDLESYGKKVGRLYYSQKSNITLTKAWEPVQNFAGVYDGENKTVSRINITSASDKVAFILTVGTTGTVKNLILQSGTVTATNASATIGGLVAINGGTITNCGAVLDVAGTFLIAGGLVGSNGGTVQKSFSGGNISGGQTTGGVVGKNEKGSRVTNCFSYGKAFSSLCLGGIVGENDGGEISYCQTNRILSLQNANTGSEYTIGGLVGKNNALTVAEKAEHPEYGRLYICFSTATLFYNTANVQVKAGGLIGADLAERIVKEDIVVDEQTVDGKSYFNTDYANVKAYAGCADTDFEKETSEILQNTLTMPGFERASGWNESFDAQYSLILSGFSSGMQTYLLLASEMSLWDIDITSNEPKGSQNNPYLINKTSQLIILAETTEETDYTGKYFQVGKDLTDISMVPIGSYKTGGTNYYFNGNFDGQNHTLSRLVVQNTNNDEYTALFGYTGSDFVLKNLHLDNTCVIVGGKNIASFVGFFRGEINNCYSEATLRCYSLCSLTAQTYEAGVYYIQQDDHTFTLATGVFNALRFYYEEGTNAGGFVGSLASNGNKITNSIFKGVLPNADDSYGFVGMKTNGSMTLVSTNSWYITNNTSYEVNSSYGRVLLNYTDVNNEGVVQVHYTQANGYENITISCDSAYKPYLYGRTGALPFASTYRLLSDVQETYRIRYTQKLTFEVKDESNADASSVLSFFVENDGYYYPGQMVTIPLTWKAGGYYLKNNAKINNISTSVVDNLTAGSDINYTFSMQETASGLSVVFTVAPVTSSILEIIGISDGENKEYDGTAVSVSSSCGASWDSSVTVYGEDGKICDTIQNAQRYTISAQLLLKSTETVIGKLEYTYTVSPKELTLKDTLNAQAYTKINKEYDGSTGSSVEGIETAENVFGLCGGEESILLNADVLWTQANVGTGIAFTLKNMVLSGEGAENYCFADGYEKAYTGGQIYTKSVLITVAEAEEDNTVTYQSKSVYVWTVDYNGGVPTNPTDEYITAVTWHYQKLSGTDNLSIDGTWTAGATYGVGYYLMTATANDPDNYALTHAQKYLLHILPYEVTSYDLVGAENLFYTGNNLLAGISATFAGIGNDRNPFAVQLTAYKGGETVTEIKKVGNYTLQGSSANPNYVINVTPKPVQVKRAQSSVPFTFTLYKGADEVVTGGEIGYEDVLWIEFTDTLSNQADYDAKYRISFYRQPSGGDLSIYYDETAMKWYIKPEVYGSNMEFDLEAIDAENYENRVSDITNRFTLTVKPVTLYVVIGEQEQTYGDIISYDLKYYRDDACSVEVIATDIQNLTAPNVSTGSKVVKDVGSYTLFYSGGFSDGYIFNTTLCPTLTVVPKQVEVRVSGISNYKTYGDADPAIRYLIYDGTSGEELITLPNREKVTLSGSLSRASGENVGAYAITAGNITQTALNPNYLVSFSGGLFVIRQRNVVLQVKANQYKYYSEDDQMLEIELSSTATDESGNLYTKATWDLMSSFIYGEDAPVSLTREEGERVNAYSYICVINSDKMQRSNYNILRVDVLDKYRIVPATPDIIFNEPTVYYGQSTSEINMTLAEARFNGSIVSGKFSFTEKTFSSMDATLVTLNFMPTDTQNYSKASIKFYLTPQKREVRLQIDGETAFTYTGERHRDFLTITVLGTVSGGKYTLKYDTIEGDNRNVTEEGFYVLIDFKSDCYVLANGTPSKINCKILPAVVQVGLENVHILQGETFEPNISYSGFIGTDSEGDLSAFASVKEIPTEAGSYILKAEGAKAKNYVFRYDTAVLTIDATTLEGEGVMLEGVFSPDLTVRLTRVGNNTQAFADSSETIDALLGGSKLLPLQSTMSSYYQISFNQSTYEDTEITYSLTMEEALPEGTHLYVRKTGDEVQEITDYILSEDRMTVTFTSGEILALVTYTEKDTKTIVLGYLPLAGVCIGGFFLLVVISALVYTNRHRKPKNRYFAERAKLKSFTRLK